MIPAARMTLVMVDFIKRAFGVKLRASRFRFVANERAFVDGLKLALPAWAAARE